MRGLIKISPNGGSGILPTLVGFYDVIAGIEPYIVSGIKSLRNVRYDYAASEYYLEREIWLKYLRGGYLVYPDNLELIYHGRETEAYYGTGNNAIIQTNEAQYREIRFKTTITPTDPDLPTPIVQAVRRGGILDLLLAVPATAIDRLMGVEQIKAYFRKRGNFMRDCDDVPCTIESYMFLPIRGFITANQMSMDAGSELATFDVIGKEIVGLKTVEGDKNTHAPLIEPGVHF